MERHLRGIPNLMTPLTTPSTSHPEFLNLEVEKKPLFRIRCGNAICQTVKHPLIKAFHST